MKVLRVWWEETSGGGFFFGQPPVTEKVSAVVVCGDSDGFLMVRLDRDGTLFMLDTDDVTRSEWVEV